MDSNGKIGEMLWRWGIPTIAILSFFVALAHVFAIFHVVGAEIVANHSDGALKYLAFCVAALAVLRSGNILKAKFLGVEFEFNSIVDYSNKQEAEIQELKNSVLALQTKCRSFTNSDESQVNDHEIASIPKMPILPPIRRRNDQNKDRFGGENSRERDGYIISADFFFKNIDDPVVKVVLLVRKKDGSSIDKNVRFFLHETFGENQEITVAPKDGRISYQVLAYGGFTVGVWIVGTETLLELDLALEPGAPTVIRER